MKKMKNRQKRLSGVSPFLFLVFIVFSAFADYTANAQENYVRDCATRFSCTLDTGVSWSSSTRTYLFTPISPDTSFRLWIHNNNTTNGHTAQTVTAWGTSSNLATSLVNNADQWVQLALIQNSTANASCNAVAKNNPTGTPGAQGMGTCYSQGMYTAQIAIRITPGGSAAGSPDTFDIGIVQCTNNHCNYPGGPQPGNDSSAAGGTNISSIAGVNISGASGAFGTGASIPVQGGAPNNSSDTSSPVQLGSPFLIACDAGAISTTLLDPGIAGQTGIVNCDTHGGIGISGWAGNSTVPNDALETASLANMAPSGGAFISQRGLLMGEKGPRWAAISNPAAGSQATANKAALASGRHVADCISFSAGAIVAPLLTSLTINLRDGATGAGTVIWTQVVTVTAAIGEPVSPFSICGLNLTGSTNTAMTLEFSASLANLSEAVSLSGYDVQ